MTTFDENSSGTSRTRSTTTDNLKTTATTTSEKLRDTATQKLNASRVSAADEIDQVAQATRTAAADLDDQQRQELSHYVSGFADSISTLAQSLRNKNVDELVSDVEKLAREHPALFIGGSIALGLGIARFAKASSNRVPRSEISTTDTLSNTGSAYQTEYKDYSQTEQQDYSTGYDASTPTNSGNGLARSNRNSLGGTQYE